MSNVKSNIPWVNKTTAINKILKNENNIKKSYPLYLLDKIEKK